MALLSGACLLSAGCTSLVSRASNDELVSAVTDAEKAFARTIVDRDHRAFLRFVSAEAVFLNGGKPIVGRDAVGKHWERFYAAPRRPSRGSPISWSCSRRARWRSRSGRSPTRRARSWHASTPPGGSRRTAGGAWSSTTGTMSVDPTPASCSRERSLQCTCP